MNALTHTYTYVGDVVGILRADTFNQALEVVNCSNPTHLRYLTHMGWLKGGIIKAGITGCQRRSLGGNADTALRLALDDNGASVTRRGDLRVVGFRRHVNGQRSGSARSTGGRRHHCRRRAALICVSRHRFMTLQVELC